MAQGSKQHHLGNGGIIPAHKLVATFKELQVECELPLSGDFSDQPEASPRPWYEDPEWVEELADSLHFREKLRYRFRKG